VSEHNAAYYEKQDADRRAGGTVYEQTTMADFDGATYIRGRDHARLSGQMLVVFDTMKGGGWWSLKQLASRARGSETSASARLRDLRKPKFGGHEVERRYMGAGLWQYRLIVRENE
jgi:hypothetical protein